MGGDWFSVCIDYFSLVSAASVLVDFTVRRCTRHKVRLKR